MKIINLNSEFTLSDDVVEYARTLIRNYEIAPGPSIHYPSTMADLVREMPVFLVDRATQEKYDEEGHDGKERLGFYCHTGPILGFNRPVIGLCVEAIREQAMIDGALDRERFKILTAMVLIHEFAHALMAVVPGSSIQGYRPQFYVWVEEPMANMITLEYFARHEQSNENSGHGTLPNGDPKRAFEIVRTFMLEKQPKQYQLGTVFYDQGIRQWWLWRNEKSTSLGKTNAAADWLNFVASPQADVQSIDSNDLRKCFHNLVGTQISEVDHNGATPIHHAVMNGDVDQVKRLLGGEIYDFNAGDAWGKSALSYAVYSLKNLNPGHLEPQSDADTAKNRMLAARKCVSLLLNENDFTNRVAIQVISEHYDDFNAFALAMNDQYRHIPECLRLMMQRMQRGKDAFGM